MRKKKLYDKVIDSAYALKSYEVIMGNFWERFSPYQHMSVTITIKCMRFRKNFWTVLYNILYNANL